MMDSELLIKILVDNNASADLVEEHGFSVWIEICGRKILIDTGQGGALLSNAVRLGCDLRELDLLILSHGHYDHCGAVSSLLEINPELQIYAHSNLLVPRYSIKPDQAARCIGVPQYEKEILLALPDGQMHWINGYQQLLPAVWVTGMVDRQNSLEDTGGPFYLDQDKQKADLIEDDMSVWLETPQGVVIVTGCCHAGLVNTVRHIQNARGAGRIRGIVGGLHLMDASCERIKSTVDILRELDPDFVVPCHCTGDDVVGILKAELGSMVIPGYAGYKIEISKSEV